MWKNIKKKKPKKTGDYLAVLRSGVICILQYDQTADIWSEPALSDYGIYITHWKHLPKPPDKN